MASITVKQNMEISAGQVLGGQAILMWMAQQLGLKEVASACRLRLSWSYLPLEPPTSRGPQDHINMRILHSGSEAHYKGNSTSVLRT